MIVVSLGDSGAGFGGVLREDGGGLFGLVGYCFDRIGGDEGQFLETGLGND